MHSVSENALIRRINRRLHHEGQRIRTCPYNSRDFHELGRHYAIDDRNCIVAKHVDLEQWVAELDANTPRV